MIDLPHRGQNITQHRLSQPFYFKGLYGSCRKKKIRVPQAVGDFMILEAVRESGGVAMSSPEADISKWMGLANSKEGLAVCPETAVCLGVQDQLMGQGKVKPKDRVLVFNTGAAQKYPESVKADLPKIDLNQPVDWGALLSA